MKKRILFVLESLGGGGAEKVFTTLLRHMDKDQYDVTLCAIVDNGKDVDLVTPYANFIHILDNCKNYSGLKKFLYSIKYKLIYEWFPMWLVYRIFVPKGYDVEVAFVEGFATKLLAASTNKKAKKVAWVHCDLKEFPWPVNTGVFKSLDEEKAAYSKYDEVAVVSEASKSHFIEIYGLVDRTRCIYNPIDRRAIEKLASIAKRDPEDSRFRFVSVGRLTEAKGYDRLIEACARLMREGFDFELWIVGEGSDRALLEKKVKESGLTNMVKFLGFQKNPYQYLNQCDCFVCSSRTEGYSLVIAEAMCVWLPVIATGCAGPEEILDGGKYGVMVENSTDGLILGMKKVLSMQDLSGLKLLSAERAKSFDLERTMQEVYEVLGA